MENQNKTEIRLEINKTIQPKQYEPIKVVVDVKESFYWKDEKDRDEKMQKYTEKITVDFVKTFDQVAEAIGEKERCIGRVITSGKIPVENKKEVTPSSEDEEWDFS